MSLGDIIKSLQPELENKNKIREDAFSYSRRITLLSKQAIMAIHKADLKEAENKLEIAYENIYKAKELLSPYQCFMESSLSIAYQEYSEAQIFYQIIKNERYPDPKSLMVPTIPYLLGLADVIGEFRRKSLDMLREGVLNEAEKFLKIMEQIFEDLLPLQYSYSIIPELRRKCDVARRLIELTLSDVSMEKGRKSLKDTLDRFEEKIK